MFYVAAEGPMPNTVDTFWQAVWEADVYLVIRLTSKEEEDCFTYLPGSSDHCLQLGEVGIHKFYFNIHSVYKRFCEGHLETMRI